MIQSKIIQALIAIMAGLFMAGMLSAILLPAVEGSTQNLPVNTQDTITTILVVALLGVVIGFPILIYRWLQKRTAAPEGEITEREKNPKIAFSGLAVLCIGILVYDFTVSTNRVTDLAFLLGQNLVIGLLWYVVYSGLLGKHLSAPQKTFSYILILASLIIGSYIAAENQLQQENLAMARMQGNIQRVMGSEEFSDGKIALIETDSTAAQSQDSNIVIEAWLNNYLNRTIENQNDYMTELEAVNYLEILDGQRIKADADLTESKFILDRTREIIDKYEELGYETLYSARDQIQSLNVSESEKRAIENGLNGNLQSGIDTAKKVWALEKQLISDAEKILVFLNTIDANWTLEDEQLLFTNTKSLNIYNFYMSEFDKTASEQTQIRESSSQNVENIFQKNAN